MPEPRVFLFAPPPRCGEPLDLHTHRFCGELASWVDGVPLRPTFRCDAHRSSLERPAAIAGELAVRRVCVTLQVYVAGVTLDARVSQAEALDYLDRLVRQAGGVLNVVSVSSDVGRACVQPAPGRKRMAKARV